MELLDSLVIGAGQGGLSASHHLGRLDIPHVVLDANPAPGGAWQHRWDSLTMDDVHGVADLPGEPAPPRSHERANEVVPAYFAAYERRHGLPVARPVRVESVTAGTGEDDGLLVVQASERTWRTRTLVNATGTWDRPFVPRYPGQELFRGWQLHTHSYPGPARFVGKRVIVVGGGASAVQFIGELAPITDVLWVTRRPPVWVDHFDGEAGYQAVEKVHERVLAGLPPESVVSVTGLHLRPQEQEAKRLGAYERRRPMFASVEADGVRWADGSFEPVDVILWATGFRPSITHLAGLGLRSRHGGIQLVPTPGSGQTPTAAAADPRVQLVGYGPSASTIGANRAGRAAALAVRRHLRAAAAPR
ncbi:NAD(P)-binding domain-containing protein [Nocardioides sp. AE5]|uniref:NAD(P)-binding domain-containing protein n=1 Tax=Nocardioides sp. AE5 TaxID=2962573 RepID=UPI0028819508|nr:NAD(P)-binding domain-containing protein [Nocardioides sp. AE5]MDT0202220.1 NAD(P)-binding domain-containing protein [Nocardioides sp. AE5]